jgi:hypothetical protein
MKLQKLPGLLILLVSSAFLDDAWAAATVDTADDIQASANNEYLRTSPRPESPSAREELAPPGGQATDHAGPPVPVPAVGAPGERPLTPVGTPLLYTLMSLQR